MTQLEFNLKVIEKVAQGHYGVKVREDGSVYLDVLGYMQADGSIGEDKDPNFNIEDKKEYKL